MGTAAPTGSMAARERSVTRASSGAENAVGTGGRATRPAIRVPNPSVLHVREIGLLKSATNPFEGSAEVSGLVLAGVWLPLPRLALVSLASPDRWHRGSRMAILAQLEKIFPCRTHRNWCGPAVPYQDADQI